MAFKTKESLNKNLKKLQNRNFYEHIIHLDVFRNRLRKNISYSTFIKKIFFNLSFECQMVLSLSTKCFNDWNIKSVWLNLPFVGGDCLIACFSLMGCFLSGNDHVRKGWWPFISDTLQSCNCKNICTKTLLENISLTLFGWLDWAIIKR